MEKTFTGEINGIEAELTLNSGRGHLDSRPEIKVTLKANGKSQNLFIFIEKNAAQRITEQEFSNAWEAMNSFETVLEVLEDGTGVIRVDYKTGSVKF